MKAAMWILISLLMASPAHAFYCNEKLISTGDHALRVRAACGEPASIHRYVVYTVREFVPIYPTRASDLRHQKHGHVIPPAVQYVVPVAREEWLYNFGSERLLQRLTFQNGYVHEIGTAGYGF